MTKENHYWRRMMNDKSLDKKRLFRTGLKNLCVFFHEHKLCALSTAGSLLSNIQSADQETSFISALAKITKSLAADKRTPIP